MKKSLLIVALTIFLSSSISFAQKSLFNGKDLMGWHSDVPAKDNAPNTPDAFIIRSGLLVSLGEPRGHLITDAVTKIIV